MEASDVLQSDGQKHRRLWHLPAFQLGFWAFFTMASTSSMNSGLPHFLQLLGGVVFFPALGLDDEHVTAISLRLFNVNHPGTLKPPGCCIRLAVAPAHCLCQRIDALTRLLIYNFVEL